MSGSCGVEKVEKRRVTFGLTRGAHASSMQAQRPTKRNAQLATSGFQVGVPDEPIGVRLWQPA
jgi:hypothetical protein